MKQYITHSFVLVSFLLFAACGQQKWQEVSKGSWNLVTQGEGKTLGYSPTSGVQLLTVKGYAFKDLNRNGTLDVYEDWRKPAEERAQDLAAQLSIEEIAGLMLYSAHQSIPQARAMYNGKVFAESGQEPSALTDAQKQFLQEDNLRAVLVTSVESPAIAAQWNNNVQAFVEGIGHGIPSNNSSDPRHETRATAEYNAGAGGQISLWPSTLGLAATFDPALVERFGQVASIEYRALGINTALSPQIDLATEPRWGRFSGTFGEDPQLGKDMARAYVDGFQTSSAEKEIAGGWGYESVNAMVKHWPSGGPEEAGRDGHYNYGKYAVYPGDNFETHLVPFTEGAFKLNGATQSATAVMPYYTISYGADPNEHVGNSYSHYIITDLLREKYGFEGVVCTDWGITNDNPTIEGFSGKCWGMETATIAERHYKVLQAGVDQFGGNNDKGPVLEAYQMWVKDFGEEAAKARFVASAKRLLMNIFRTGLFENPYLDPVETTAIVGNASYMAEGFAAQLKSIVMLKNSDKSLPVTPKKKVYVPKRYQAPRFSFMGSATEGAWVDPITPEVVSKYYELTDNPSEADFALVLISEPSGGGMGAGYDVADVKKGGNGYMPISLQYNDYTAEFAREESLAGGDPKESFTNRTYKGKTIKTANKSDMETVVKTKKLMKDKPVIVVVSVSKPMVMAEIEPYADAILVTFGAQNQAILDIVSGASEPSALLPMQLPKDMKTVELQYEDVPRDMECYVDAAGNAYDFAFGLNWNGVIKDARVERYK